MLVAVEIKMIMMVLVMASMIKIMNDFFILVLHALNVNGQLSCCVRCK